jgi:hypothetical protein
MLTEREGVEIATADGLHLPPLRVQVRKVHQGGRTSSTRLEVGAEWNGREHRFTAEYVSVATPGRLRTAIERIRHGQPRDLPMLVAPYLSPDALAMLENAKVSGIDLCGNGVVTADGEWLVMRTGNPNRFPSSAPIRAIYRGTSSLVGRVFLSRPEYPGIGEIRSEIQRRGGEISPSTVSKVVKGLEEDLVITRGATLSLAQPERLLDQLARNYRPVEPTVRLRGKVAESPPALYQRLRSNAESGAIRIAGRDERRYVLSPVADEVLTVYTTSIGRALDGLHFSSDDRFPNLELVEIHDQRPFFDVREEDGFVWCAPLQVYLELANGGKREREVAEQLRPDLLSFR